MEICFCAATGTRQDLVDEQQLRNFYGFLHHQDHKYLPVRHDSDEDLVEKLQLRNLHTKRTVCATTESMSCNCGTSTPTMGICLCATTGVSTTLMNCKCAGRRHAFLPPPLPPPPPPHGERWRILPSRRTPPPPCTQVKLSSQWLLYRLESAGAGSLSRKRRHRTVQSNIQHEGHPSSDLTRCPCKLLADSQLHQDGLRGPSTRWNHPPCAMPLPKERDMVGY